MKNKLLFGSAKVAIIILIVSICSLDSDSWIPTILAFVSMIYLVLFYLINEEELERWLER